MNFNSDNIINTLKFMWVVAKPQAKDQILVVTILEWAHKTETKLTKHEKGKYIHGGEKKKTKKRNFPLKETWDEILSC